MWPSPSLVNPCEFWARRYRCAISLPLPRVYLSVSLTGPDPSGSPEPTRLCRGCSHLPRRSPDRLPPASPHRHDGRAPKVSHLRPTQQRLVAHVAVLDLLASARTGPTDGPRLLDQGRRAPRAASRGRHPAPQQSTTTHELGGPGRVRRPRAAVAPSTALPSPGHPEHDPALASPPRTYQVNADGLELTSGRAGRDPGRGWAVGVGRRGCRRGGSVAGSGRASR